MNRKNAFSYIMWFLYSMAVCVSLFGISGILSSQAGYSRAVGYGISGLWLLLCGLIVFLIHKLLSNQNCTKESGGMLSLVTESLVVVLLFAVGIFLRIRGLSGAGEDAAYYELARVAEGQAIPSVVHGAVYFYLQLLHFVYLIFGNRFLAGIWLQIVLQMLAGFFCYRAVRKMAGVLASLVTLGVVMTGSMMVGESLALSPEMLFFAVFSIALYACVSCISGSKGAVPCLLTGLLIAIVSYLDVLGIALFLVTIAGILLKKSGEDCPVSGRLLGALLCSLSCSVGFVLLMLADSLASAKKWTDVILAWWKLYSPSAMELPAVLDLKNSDIELLLLLLFMAIGIFSYWCSFVRERQSLWIWFSFSLVLLQCFGMTTPEVDGYLYLYIAFAVLAGVGLASMLDRGVVTDDTEKMMEKITAETLSAQRGVKVRGSVETEGMESEPAAPETPKISFIENPMALPKKHVKKVLDYDRELREGQEDYDLIVEDNDDYDL